MGSGSRSRGGPAPKTLGPLSPEYPYGTSSGLAGRLPLRLWVERVGPHYGDVGDGTPQSSTWVEEKERQEERPGTSLLVAPAVLVEVVLVVLLQLQLDGSPCVRSRGPGGKSAVARSRRWPGGVPVRRVLRVGARGEKGRSRSTLRDTRRVRGRSVPGNPRKSKILVRITFPTCLCPVPT